MPVAGEQQLASANMLIPILQLSWQLPAASLRIAQRRRKQRSESATRPFLKASTTANNKVVIKRNNNNGLPVGLETPHGYRKVADSRNSGQ
jgi:hypothetical protein